LAILEKCCIITPAFGLAIAKGSNEHKTTEVVQKT
jgi:hypothetical protein